MDSRDEASRADGNGRPVAMTTTAGRRMMKKTWRVALPGLAIASLLAGAGAAGVTAQSLAPNAPGMNTSGGTSSTFGSSQSSQGQSTSSGFGQSGQSSLNGQGSQASNSQSFGQSSLPGNSQSFGQSNQSNPNSQGGTQSFGSGQSYGQSSTSSFGTGTGSSQSQTNGQVGAPSTSFGTGSSNLPGVGTVPYGGVTGLQPQLNPGWHAGTGDYLNATVQGILQQPSQWVGKFVVLGGTPNQVIANNAFTLGTDQERMLVVAQSPWVQIMGVQSGSYLQLIGLVEWMSPQNLQNNFGISPQRAPSGAQNGVPIVVAVQMNTGRGWIDLTQGNGVYNGFNPTSSTFGSQNAPGTQSAPGTQGGTSSYTGSSSTGGSNGGTSTGTGFSSGAANTNSGSGLFGSANNTSGSNGFTSSGSSGSFGSGTSGPNSSANMNGSFGDGSGNGASNNSNAYGSASGAYGSASGNTNLAPGGMNGSNNGDQFQYGFNPNVRPYGSPQDFNPSPLSSVPGSTLQSGNNSQTGGSGSQYGR